MSPHGRCCCVAADSPDAGSSSGGGELGVLGLHGAYHGDTLGSQDCVAPSAFNGPLQSPWYTGRGAFLEPPYVGMRQVRARSFLGEEEVHKGGDTGVADEARSVPGRYRPAGAQRSAEYTLEL